MPAPLTADLAPAHCLTTDDLAFLRLLPGSTEPPIEGSREQRARADRLPGGLLHRGRRTPLGDLVVSLAERAEAAEARLRDLLAPADDADEAVDAAEVLRLDGVATPAPWRPKRGWPLPPSRASKRGRRVRGGGGPARSGFTHRRAWWLSPWAGCGASIQTKAIRDTGASPALSRCPPATP